MEEEIATHSSIIALKIPWAEGVLVDPTVHGVTEVGHD